MIRDYILLYAEMTPGEALAYHECRQEVKSRLRPKG